MPACTGGAVRTRSACTSRKNREGDVVARQRAGRARSLRTEQWTKDSTGVAPRPRGGRVMTVDNRRSCQCWSPVRSPVGLRLFCWRRAVRRAPRYSEARDRNAVATAPVKFSRSLLRIGDRHVSPTYEGAARARPARAASPPRHRMTAGRGGAGVPPVLLVRLSQRPQRLFCGRLPPPPVSYGRG